MKETICKKGLCCFIALILLMLLICIGPMNVYADDDAENSSGHIVVESEDAENTTQITAQYYNSDREQTYSFTMPYSDEYFQRDSGTFYMDLARISFGLTVSAFRTSDGSDAALDQNACDYLTQAGFENFESTWYDQEPTENSVASVIAEKRIGDETVIAFACNGASYGAEWISNLTLGNGTVHKGFSDSADICEERLMDYIERLEITGTVKLWISGYSRAAGVGNCLASKMIEEGCFADVYAYFFATPNTTQDPAEYPNIFNIVGQNDPVSQITFASWGYGRNGIDVYTPAQESNSSYYPSSLEAGKIYYSLTGDEFYNNPDLCRQLHVIAEYLIDIFPTGEDYVSILQPKIIEAYHNYESDNLLTLLREALSGIDNFTDEQQEAADVLGDYIDTVLYQYISGNDYQIFTDNWDTDGSLAQNLFLEHLSQVYASWLFSEDDPESLFVDDTETVHLVIKGTFDVEVWDDYGIVQSISFDNEEEIYEPGGGVRPEDADYVYLYVSNHDGNVVINIPADRNYTLKLYPQKTKMVSMISDSYSYGYVNNSTSNIVMFPVKKDRCVILSDFFAEGGIDIETENGKNIKWTIQRLGSDSESLMAREGLIDGSFTVMQVLHAIGFFVLVPILMFLAILLIFLIGRKRARQKIKTAITVCYTANAVIMGTGAVFFSLLLPNIRIAAAIYAVLAFIMVGINALRSRNLKIAGLEMLLAVCAFADYFFIFHKGIALWCAVIMAVILTGGVLIELLTKRKISLSK